MEEERYNSVDNELRLLPKPENDYVNEQKVDHDLGNHEALNNQYLEETSAEFAVPQNNRVKDIDQSSYDPSYGIGFGGTLAGTVALIVSIISLFTMPFLLGILGIIGGFIARSKGAKSLGTWAIGIGAVSIIVGIFILPFF